MSSEASNYTLSRSDPDTMTELWTDPSKTYRFDRAFAEECALELYSLWEYEDFLWGDDDFLWDDDDFLWDDEDETIPSLLGTEHDPIPAPNAGMDYQSENGRQEIMMWEATTDCGVAAQKMVPIDLEMLDVSADPAYIDHHYAEEPEEMEWEPCHSTDADNDISMMEM